VSHTRRGLIALLARQFGRQRAAAAVIVATVITLSFLAIAAPRSFDALVSQELRHELAQLPAASRDLSASPIGVAPVVEGSTIDEVWGSLTDSVSAIKAGVGPDARALLGDGDIVASTAALFSGMGGYDLGAFDPETSIALLSGPTVFDHVHFVTGTPPAPADPRIATLGRGSTETTVDEPLPPIEIALSSAAASTMNWPIGQTRTASKDVNHSASSYRLSGTFEPNEPASDYWSHLPATTTKVDVFDDGNHRPIATATAIVSPLSWPVVTSLYSFGVGTVQHTTVWYPLDPAGISRSNAEAVRDQLRKASATVVPIGTSQRGIDAPRTAFSTSVIERLDTTVGRSDATTSVVLVAIAGPLGVAIAVLALAARLIALRKRDTMSLVAARGGSDTQVRSVLAIEGLVYGIPAAVIGFVLGSVVVPGSTGAVSIVVATIAALAPAAVLAASAAPGSLRAVRTDIDAAPRSRLRTIVDLAIGFLALAAVALLVLRGPVATGIDPLLILAPILVSVAVSVLVLRVYPLPVRIVETALGRRDQAAALLGSMRTARDPAAGLAPVLAMIVTVSVAMFSGVMLATLTSGTVTAAQHDVGGDVRLAGPQFLDADVTGLRAIDGVTGVTPVEVIGSGTVRAGRASVPVTVIVTDTAALAEQQAGLADATPELPEARDRDLTVVISSSLARQVDTGAELTLGNSAMTVVGTTDVIAGSGAIGDWVLVDRSQQDELDSGGFAPRVLLIATANDEATARVVDWAASSYGVGIQVESAADRIGEIRESPFVSGLATALTIVIALIALLCTFCVVLMTTIGGAERTRLLALLGTLGFSRGQARTMIAWELGPIALVALVAGGTLGLALPLLVLAGVDLTPFTGGSTQPLLAVDPWSLLGTVVGFCSIIVTATLITIATARERPLAAILRSGEE
jgi:putative ABC transport system permease protein